MAELIAQLRATELKSKAAYNRAAYDDRLSQLEQLLLSSYFICFKRRYDNKIYACTSHDGGNERPGIDGLHLVTGAVLPLLVPGHLGVLAAVHEPVPLRREARL